MAKTKTLYRCSDCSHTVAKWVGRCPECGTWGSMDEAPVQPVAVASRSGTSLARAGAAAVLPSTPATPLSQIDGKATHAKPTGIPELDRVLGGGVVPGSVVLLAGEPGVGKSTLLLEVVHRWALRGEADRALYVTGEESAGQVRLRADRTGAVHDRVYLAAENDLATIFGHVEQVKPTLLVVDSVQTMLAADVDGVTGGVTQVRAVTSALTSLAKSSGIPVLLIGHVTKDGAVAGPRSLEHLVDVVLHFEGDKHSTLRMVRGVKNRFGAADEVGCFELAEDGIVGVSDPSGLFLQHRDEAVPGTAVTVTMDGKRPLLGEVQALVVPTHNPSPRRAVSGLDSARVAMVLAVLERRCGLGRLGNCDVYASTVGGMRITDPSADLALALAVASAVRDQPVPAGTVLLGEVGLAGEVRRVVGAGRRLAEANRLGFDRGVVPRDVEGVPKGMKKFEVSNVAQALSTLTR
ncbi:DNA repair protein RadA [Rhodococcus pyridinivorans]|uniref:DNA repair protein RadA n=4 Tax=Rhodococcus TaxID=1827 RepID=V9XKH1_9NOCA|nr:MULTISPECIES: DNA repair protein RadA [Rhodococcus]AHD22534.1 DNA repair protein RadA [Rhodococcus pyridinivorans SB3094]APE11746.1 DNA repair protein RadA [Rhodococcus sp. 2G]EHK85954.1 DNA repair protein RadA [Rhodococcus pyridinivorans AK37]MBX4169442.1 DNA repair protein RadA [Rhodococcus sp. DMU2021]MCD2118038.1 DNA repair protein RadA [Rhodococcus pyridinivorans]